MRNKQQHEGKGKNGHATIITCITPPCIFFYVVTHVMTVACPSLAFAFMLLPISHAIITGFACIYCILFLYFSIVIPTSFIISHFDIGDLELRKILIVYCMCMWIYMFVYLVFEGVGVDCRGQMQSMCIDQFCTTKGVIQHIWRKQSRPLIYSTRIACTLL